MKLRPLLLAALTIAAALIPATGAMAFRGNNFQSPTGNIVCRYDARNAVMACLTRNDNFTAAVSLWGRSYKTNGGSFRGGPVLRYGHVWTANRRFRCWSRTSGMTCRSVKTGHGFFISRTSYRLF